MSTAALLLGISNGFLYSLFGPWSYTRTARTAVNHVVMGRPGPGLLYWFLFAALLGGVLLSSLTRRSFILDWRFRLDWAHPDTTSTSFVNNDDVGTPGFLGLTQRQASGSGSIRAASKRTGITSIFRWVML